MNAKQKTVKFAITRLFSVEGHEPFRRYMNIYTDFQVVTHQWVDGRRMATTFNSSRKALDMMAKHVPQRKQHKCEVISWERPGC